MSPESVARPGRWSRWFLFGSVLLLALNLRPAVTSLGAVLPEVSADLSLSPTLAGVLTTLPVLCFAVFGASAASFARRIGPRHVLVASLTAVVIGSVVRVLVDNAVLFMAATVLALAGMATGNVLIPAIVRARFPNRIGLVTAAYTTVLAIGTTTPAALTVPITEASGSWRIGLGTWAATAAIALLPWLFLARGEQPPGASASSTSSSPPTSSKLRDLVHSRIAWALALYFGLQSMQAYVAFGWLAQVYRDAGLDAAHAGFLLSLLPIAGVPISLAIPTIAAKLPDQRLPVLGCGICYVLGYLGLMISPAGAPLLWVLLIGLGGGAFPLCLTMIGLRARSSEVTIRLSAFTQSVGYLIAAVGPLTVGALYGATGGWTVPIALLLVLVAPKVVVGMIAAKPGYVDDQLKH